MISLLLALTLFGSVNTAPSVAIQFECDNFGFSSVIVTNTSAMPVRIYAFESGTAEAEEQLVAPGETTGATGTSTYEVWIWDDGWILVESGAFPVCEQPTTTTQPYAGPAESIQVCRDRKLIFIDPGDRLETDTDVCEVAAEETTTTTLPAETSTTPPPVTSTTQPAVPQTAQTTQAAPNATLTELPFTGIENGLGLLAGFLLLAGILLVSLRDSGKPDKLDH
jgi:hypothetical protein